MIDSHQHFWRLARGGYGWMPENVPALNRDHEPPDLMPLLQACDLSGTIAVQADDNVEETEFLLSLAAEHPWILGVVGWVDLIPRSRVGQGSARNPVEICSADPSAVQFTHPRTAPCQSRRHLERSVS